MDYDAVRKIGLHALENEGADKEIIEQMLDAKGVDTNIDLFAQKLLYGCDVTLNFHPDRFSKNGKIIIDNLIDDGEYHNQYKTGTSNGGLNTYMGGDRDLWEKRLFMDAYHDGRSQPENRPKYGALNIHNYIDGASARFGSCFFTLKPHVAERCTFAFGDSSTNPGILGTANCFFGIVRALFESVRDCGYLLNKGGFTIKSAAQYILSMEQGRIHETGRNLDHCIETHVHGRVSMLEDVDAFYLDESFVGSQIEQSAKILSDRYEIELRHIPKRRFAISEMDDEWKGPLARPLAQKTDEKFGGGGMLDAALIGCASRDSMVNQSDWLDIGSEIDLFQNFKYLWHYVAYFG